MRHSSRRPFSGARAAAALWSGLLAVDKPGGITSHDVVARVRRRLAAPGAGHLGTLDPMATGLLLVALGTATRCIRVWQGGEKTYQGAVLFGVTTDTQDITGTVLARRPVELDEATVREAARALTGPIAQTPPMVSAVKVGGERLYRLARRGVEVERPARPVVVHEWSWSAFDLPRARFTVRCSSGTYVRTLAHDLGQRLGCGAALEQLRRTGSAPFDLERSVTAGDLDVMLPTEVLERGGIPLHRALAHLPRVDLDPAAAEAFGHGRRIPLPEGTRPMGGAVAPGPGWVAFFGRGETVLGLGELVSGPDGHEVLAVPRVVLASAGEMSHPISEEGVPLEDPIP